MRSVRRAGWVIGGSWLLLAGPVAATGSSGPETAGYHLLRPGESLDSVARRYLGSAEARGRIAARNPRSAKAQPGTRLLVELEAGLPRDGAILSRLGGRVEAQPTPIEWLKGRLFDLLLAGDGLRTYASASAEVAFADTTRLLITEESLVFLRGAAAQRQSARGEAIEIVAGQADIKPGATRLAPDQAIEIVMGQTRARTTPNRAGVVDARARRQRGGPEQLMVYRGSGEVVSAGKKVQLAEGTGTRVSAGLPPTPPERLLPAPTLMAPLPEAKRSPRAFLFSWQPVAGAAGYTFELCRDPDCGELVARKVALPEGSFEVADLSGGRYFWRVTASAASGLDGFPSPSEAIDVAVRKAAGRLARTSDPAPGLPGASAGAAPSEASAAEVPFVAYDEIVVQPSRVSLMGGDPTAPLALSREDILSLPHFGDDIFKALPLLPGTTANDIAAQFHVRGGRRDEVEILLDGQELYGAYHLQDYDNALSIVAPDTLAGVDLLTGALPASHGDRMGGVLDMSTTTPSGGRTTWLGASMITAQAGSSGTFAGERGTWLLNGRRGSVDLAGKIFDQERPRYWDLLGTASYRFGERQTLRGHTLVSHDRLTFDLTNSFETKSRQTQHGSKYVWLTHQAIVGNDALVDTAVSWSRIDSNRTALELDDEEQLQVQDRRAFAVVELRQGWNLQAGPRHAWSWGLGGRRYSADYDYDSSRHFDTPLAAIRVEPREGVLTFSANRTGTHSGAYLADRARLGPRLTLDLGARYDGYSWLGEHLLSPRASLAYAVGESSVIRAAWGRFHQSQRPYELQVEDAREGFSPAERSAQWLLGFEHVVGGSRARRLSGLAVRLEAYRREVSNPRVRFENLYQPYSPFPELEPDRVLFAGERGRSQGVELFVRGPAGRTVGWWLTYAYASTADRIAGRWVPRQIDQTHTVNLNVAMPLGKHWKLDTAWRYRTGWPTTPLHLLTIPGEPVPEDPGGDDDDDEEGEGGDGGVVEPPPPPPTYLPALGPLNSLRMREYHRLDLRASRDFELRSGRMTLFVDVQNVYSQRNQAGTDILIDEELGTLLLVEELWPGFVPSLGISWRF